MQAIEASLGDEKRKLDQLRAEQQEADLDAKIERLLEQHRAIDENEAAMQSDLDRAKAKRTSIMSELDILATRDESLQKDKNSAMLKMKELKGAIDELIETAAINKTITLEGDEAAADLSQMEHSSAIQVLTDLLETKGDIERIQSKNVDFFKSLHSEYAKKVRELEAVEDKFNQCVAVIPETEENTMKLTHEINQLRD